MIEVRLNAVDFWVTPLGDEGIEDKQLGFLDSDTGIRFYVPLTEDAVKVLKKNIGKKNATLRKEVAEAQEREAAEASSEALKAELDEQ